MTNASVSLVGRMGDRPWLTDGGLETELLFHDGRDLPCFAAFPLLASPEGRERLERYWGGYLDAAADPDLGFVLDTPTWRASAG
jgi:homocysteine S-methyltransferase